MYMRFCEAVKTTFHTGLLVSVKLANLLIASWLHWSHVVKRVENFVRQIAFGVHVAIRNAGDAYLLVWQI